MSCARQTEARPGSSIRWYLSSALFTQRYPNTVLTVVLLVLVSLIVCAPILWYGAPFGTDVTCALAWMHGFATQLSQGDIYPRWLMDSNRGAGSPVFYYYPPVPFYITSAPATLLSQAAINRQLAWADWTLLLLSGTTFFICARSYVSNWSALLGSSLYMILPYHFETDLWIREDLAELTNYIWAPVLLYFTDRMIDGKDRRATVGLSVTYALMVLSHLPSTLVISICLSAYLLVRALFLKSIQPLLRFTLAVMTGVLLSGIYWVPAIFTQQNIHSEAWWTWYYDFHRWFFPVRSLAALRGDTEAVAYNSRIFFDTCVTTVMFVIGWLVAWRRQPLEERPRLIGLVCLVSMAWFLMTPLSAYVWEAFPPLAKIQFPSRLATVVDICTAVAVSTALPERWRHDWFSSAAFCITLALLTWCLASADVKRRLDPFNDPKVVYLRDVWVHNGVDPPEYTTRWSPYEPDAADNSQYIAGVGQVTYSESAGTVTVERWRPRDIELSVILQHPSALTVRQFYFPNWRANILGGASISLTPNRGNGLISMSLPAGRYRVLLDLVPSVQERLGYAASCGGILILAVLWYSHRRSRSLNSSVTQRLTSDSTERFI